MFYQYAIRILFWALAAGCMLNLNGVGVLVTGVNQLYSPILLASSLSLVGIAFFRSTPVSQEVAIYFGALFLYLLIGTSVVIMSVDNIELQEGLASLLSRYFTASLVIIASFYGAYIAYKQGFQPMTVLLVLCAIATFFIPFGNLLNISGKIIVDSQRGAGLFGNPNEAGIVAAVGFALTQIIVSRKLVKVLLSAFFVFMSMLTFSKTGLILIVLIYFTNSLFKGRMSIAVFRMLFALLSFIAILSLFKQDIVSQFEGQQAKRVEQFIDIALLQPPDDVVESSRGYLWRIGFDIIEESPIVGSGLGALHSMKGANSSVNNKVAQGVHNSYLLKLGDAGILALAAFVAFIGIVGYRSFKLASIYPHAQFCLMYLIVFIIDCVSSHNVELLRFHNFLIGFSLASLFIAKRLHTGKQI